MRLQTLLVEGPTGGLSVYAVNRRSLNHPREAERQNENSARKGQVLLKERGDGNVSK